jgi:hypothetical protein
MQRRRAPRNIPLEDQLFKNETYQPSVATPGNKPSATKTP